MSKTSQNPRREHSETTGPAQYFLVTKRGTKLETFKSFVETLPDGGRGYQMASRGLGDQSYITTLTYEEAKEIARKPFIEYVVLAATPLGTVPNIIPGPKPSRESIAMSDTSNESDCEDSGTKEPVEYLITTKEGTKLSTFERFIKTLPDRGEGHLMVFELLQEQSYVTKLTYERAMEVAKEPFVDYVILAGAVEKTDPMISGAPIPEQSTNSCNTSDQGFGRRLTAGQHLRILSHPRQSEEEKNQGPWAAYKYDPVLGKGQTIYIIDSGFNTGHEEMLGDRIRATITLSNRLTLSDIPDRTLWPCENDPTDYCGHGTLVASIAAGQLYGVASNANIVVVKMRQTFFHPNGSWEDITLRPVTRKALRKVWADIVEDVLRRRSQGDRGKSIVCVSSGFSYLPPQGTNYWNHVDNVISKALTRCWRNDIITVIAAGNNGRTGGSLDWATPQNLGQLDNPLITVGGVNRRGALWPETSFDVGRGGSMTVYAVAENVLGANGRPGQVAGAVLVSGTSVAAPAVAGLAAYFASLPSLASEWRQGHVAMDMKRYIVRHALERAKWPIPRELPLAYICHPEPRLGPILVAYNRAPDGLCSARKPPGDDPETSICSLMEGLSTPGSAPAAPRGDSHNDPTISQSRRRRRR